MIDKTMDEVDVLIVGGGPAGSSVAWGLRRSGITVAVMDKAEFPRHKVCAGWITPAVVQELGLDLSDYGRGRVLQPIHGFRIGMIGGRAVETRYDGEPASFGIRRCEFDHYLLVRSGAQLIGKTPLRDMTRSADRWVVNGSLRAGLVVGAGGHFCPVARVLGAQLGQGEVVVAAQEVEFAMTPAQAAACPVREDIPELFFCEDLKGYGWVFRKQGFLNVGLGREDNYKLAEHVAAFCAFLRGRGRVPFELPVKFNGHAYLLYHRTRRTVVSDGVLLAGDAAGLAYPQSGEGIRPAIESGLLAAQVIGAAAGNYRRADLQGYVAKLEARFGARRRGGDTAALLPEVIKLPLARRLLSTRWFDRLVVMDRWFLHRHQPLVANPAP